MRFLLDTNILISREDYKVTPPEIRTLFRLGNLTRTEFVIHPASIEDIKRDKNEERRKIVLTKIEAYPCLTSPPLPKFGRDSSFFKKVGRSIRPNDRVDNILLYSVYKNAVDFLISEDARLHKKARRLNIGKRVLYVEDAIEYFKKLLPQNNVSAPPAIQHEYVYNLNLNDPFFNSLKDQYPEFDQWFKKICAQGRKCFVFRKTNGRIGALLIYKIEEELIEVKPILPKKKRLKLCTFKVEHTGYKLGELFIKLAIEYSIKNGIDEIYLTCFREKESEHLIELITEYGFINWGPNFRGEELYIKKLVPKGEDVGGLSPLEIDLRFYPSFYDGENIKKYIVPIRPIYHDRLFIEYKRQPTLWEAIGEFIIEGNTIKKAYLSHSRVSTMERGDIVLFYRSQDLQAVTCIGVIHEVYPKLEDQVEIMRVVAKRTVYSQQEIAEFAEKPTLVILFTLNFYFKNPLNLQKLIQLGIIQAPPQSIIQISHDNYLKIK